MPWAICLGLAENTSHKQEGVTLRFNKGFGHGYRFTFTEAERTRIYGGYADHFYSYAAVEVQFQVDPVLGNLQPPQAGLPIDLPKTASRLPLQGLWFRGILLADEQRRLRPAEAVTRAELASAIAQTINLTSPWRAVPKIADVSDTSAEFDDVVPVIAAGLMTLDRAGRFRPQDAVTREEAAMSLIGLAKLFGFEPPVTEAIQLKDDADISAASRESVHAADSEQAWCRQAMGTSAPLAAFTREEASCGDLPGDWISVG